MPQTGHLKATCRSAGGGSGGGGGGAAKAATGTCICCGKTGHVKADCKMKDKECSNCGKVASHTHDSTNLYYGRS